jgi:hypothetical protein
MNEVAPVADNPDVRHEDRDVNVRGIFVFVVLLGVLVLLSCALMYWLFGYFARTEAREKETVFPLAVAERQEPLQKRLARLPEPRLEGIEPGSLNRSGVAGWPSYGPEQALREQRLLDEYGWVDRKAGVVRIPIDRAMELLAGKLPARPEDSSSQPEPRRQLSDANSGRTEGGQR